VIQKPSASWVKAAGNYFDLVSKKITAKAAASHSPFFTAEACRFCQGEPQAGQ
jgi:hypothetical protein